jgi:integrase
LQSTALGWSLHPESDPLEISFRIVCSGRWLDDVQYQALQDHAKHVWLRGFLAVAYNFGFRKGELLGVKVRQVNLKDRTIQLPPGTTKNDKGRM